MLHQFSFQSAYVYALVVMLALVVGFFGVSIALATEGNEIEAKALIEYECNDTEWHFLITGITDGIAAPDLIHVVWDNENEEDVSLDEVTGEVAHYKTTNNLDSTVVSATAFIEGDWNGEFNLSHGPCESSEPEPEEPTLGWIKVCKVVLDNEGNVVDGNDNDGTFSISGLNFNNPTGILPNSSFGTSLSLNKDILYSDDQNDAECVAYHDLPLGNYYYGEEEITGDNWLTPLYNDKHDTRTSALSDFFPYSNELFTPDHSDDENRNLASDGHILLTEEQPNRILAVVNQYIEDEEECDCNKGIVTLALRYVGEGDGKTIHIYAKKDHEDLIATFNDVNNNDVITIDASDYWDQGKLKNHTYIEVVGEEDVNIHTSCSLDILGMTFGDLTVVGYVDAETNMCGVVGDDNDLPYAPYCGDGEINQEWEQCDGTVECTEQCLIEADQCTDLALARVNVDFVDNDGTGDASSDIFLGSVDNRIPQGAWFLLHSNGVFANDDDDVTLAGYEDVPGISLQRRPGEIRTVLHGSHDAGEEHVDGNIEFWNVTATALSSDSSGNNQLENGFNGEVGGASNDEVWLDETEPEKSFFWLTVAGADDGFFASYSDAPLCLENQKPVITLIDDDPLVLFVGGVFTDPSSTAFDTEDGDITIDVITGGDTVTTTETNTFIITYNVTDSEGLAAVEVTRMVIVQEESVPPALCSDGLDNDGDELVDIKDPGCHTDGDPENQSSYDPNDDDEFNEIPYAPYCGDGEVNQNWEQCDGSDGVGEGGQCTEYCIVDADQCTDLVLARVNTNSFENHANGDVSSDVFLGSAVNRIPESTWFAVHFDGAFLTDPDMTAASYEDVPGVAVERRVGGEVRTLIHGNHGYDGSKEHINGDVEFWNTTVVSQSNDGSGNNTLEGENFGDISSQGSMDNMPGDDEVWLEDGNDVQSFFWMTVTTGDDGFFTKYADAPMCEEPQPECSDGIDNDGDGHIDHNGAQDGDAIFLPDEGCTSPEDNDENAKPVISLVGDNPLTLTVGDTFVEPGYSAHDEEDDDTLLTGEVIVDDSAVDTNTPDTYFVTYNVTDSEGADADEVTREVIVEPKPVCFDGIDNDQDGKTDNEDPGCHTDGDPDNEGSYDPDIDDETDQGSNPACSDGLDNDGDEKADSTDEACHTDGDPQNPDSYNPDGDTENSKPVITRTGDENVEVVQGDAYTEEGATVADDEDGDITNKLVIGGDSVLPNTIGTYTVTYNATDTANVAADQVTRNVSVVASDDPAQCADGEDNDGDEKTDSADEACHTDGDPENGESYDPNIDDENEKPVITLRGGSVITLTVGDTYTEEEADVDDSEDGDIDEKLVIGGDLVNTGAPGTYIVTYNATDTQNKVADEITRTVNVNNPTPPGGGGGGGEIPISKGGGGSGGMILDQLRIFDEKIQVISEGTALVTWKTNKDATSRVLYDDDSHTLSVPTLNFGTGSDDLGYEFNTEETSSLVTQHSVIVTNVNLEDLFYFRPVSQDGTRAIGRELETTLGTVTSGESCDEYLFEFILFETDSNNPGEVRKLQIFLNEFEGFDLDVNGTYDIATIEAVNAFQNTHASDILTPWGLPEPTSNVYITTKKKVNEIYCSNEIPFPLTAAQLAEIEEFRALLAELSRQGLPLPTTPVVGQTIPVGGTSLAQETDETPQVEEEGTDVGDSLAAAIEATREDGGEGTLGRFIRGMGDFFRGLFNGDEEERKEVPGVKVEVIIDEEDTDIK